MKRRFGTFPCYFGYFCQPRQKLCRHLPEVGLQNTCALKLSYLMPASSPFMAIQIFQYNQQHPNNMSNLVLSSALEVFNIITLHQATTRHEAAVGSNATRLGAKKSDKANLWNSCHQELQQLDNAMGMRYQKSPDPFKCMCAGMGLCTKPKKQTHNMVHTEREFVQCFMTCSLRALVGPTSLSVDPGLLIAREHWSQWNSWYIELSRRRLLCATLYSLTVFLSRNC